MRGDYQTRMAKEPDYRELAEQNRLLKDIVLSAICLKLNIENGFPPHLHALNRDLAAYQRRFGGVVEMVGKAAVEMDREPREHTPSLTDEENHALLDLMNAIEAVEGDQAAARPAGWTRIVAAKDEVERHFFVRLDDPDG